MSDLAKLADTIRHLIGLAECALEGPDPDFGLRLVAEVMREVELLKSLPRE